MTAVRRRRSSRSLDRSRRSESRGARERRRRRGVVHCRGGPADLVGPGLPDRPVLSRDHDQARAVSRLRRAAGQHDAVRAERHRARRRTRRWRSRTRRFRRYTVGGGEPGYIAPDPKDPDVFFAGANNGSFLTRFNRRTGEMREVGPYPRFFSGEPSSALVERWQWTYPIIFSPVDPSVLFTSSQHVWKTVDGGQTWDKISGDLTRHDPKTMGDSGGPITHDMNSPEVYATVFALGPGKTDVNVLWAGSDDGVVQVTRDGGKTWTNVTPTGHARPRPRQPDRRVELRSRHGVHRGEEAALERPGSVHLPNARFRKDVDEDRRLAFPPTITCTPSAKIRSGAGCSTPARSTASTSRSTTAITGRRCRSTCRMSRSRTSGSKPARLRSPRTAAASVSSTTSDRSASTRIST